MISSVAPERGIGNVSITQVLLPAQRIGTLTVMQEKLSERTFKASVGNRFIHVYRVYYTNLVWYPCTEDKLTTGVL